MRGITDCSKTSLLARASAESFYSRASSLALVLLVMSMPLVGAPAEQSSGYDVVVQKDVMVEMRDGARLNLPACPVTSTKVMGEPGGSARPDAWRASSAETRA